MRSKVGLVLAGLLCLCAAAAWAESPAVRVAVQASWSDLGLVYEAAELLADVEEHLFWRFLDAYGEEVSGVEVSAEEEYETFMRLSRPLLRNEGKWERLMNYGLGMRYYSPKVQMHASMAADVERAAGGQCSGDFAARVHWAVEKERDFDALAAAIPDTEVKHLLSLYEEAGHEADEALRLAKTSLFTTDSSYWPKEGEMLEWHSADFCSLSAFLADVEAKVEPCVGISFSECWMTRTQAHTNRAIAAADTAHHYGSKLAFLHVEVFSDIKKPSTYAEVLPALKDLAERRLAHVMMRHFPSASTQPLYVQGWGAELALKNTEYRAVDETEEEDVGSQELEDEFVAGINFATAAARFPAKEKELRAMRDGLRAAGADGDIQQLKRWEMTDLGRQAAYVIDNSEDPLQLLADLTGNFPSLAKSLSSVNVSSDYNERLDGFTAIYRPGDSFAVANGRNLPRLKDFSSFHIFESALADYRIVNSLQLSGVPLDDARALIKLPEAAAARPRVDVHEGVMWVNNLEEDERYARYPSTIQEMLRPAWPGQLRFIAKNIMNVVLAVDPVEAGKDGLYKALLMFVNGGAPFRFGLLLQSQPVYPSATWRATSPSHIFACAITLVEQEQGARSALEFADSVTKFSSKAIMSALKDFLKRKIKSAELLESAAADAALARNQHMHSLGLGETLPLTFVNGVAYKTPSTMAGMTEACQSATQADYPIVQQAVGRRFLSDDDNILEYLMSQPGVYAAYEPLAFEEEAGGVFVDLASAPDKAADGDFFDELAFQSPLRKGLAAFFETDLDYYEEQDQVADVTQLLVINPSSAQGQRMIHAMLSRYEDENVFTEDTAGMRWSVAFIGSTQSHNYDNTKPVNVFADVWNVATANVPYKKRIRFLQAQAEAFLPGLEEGRFDVTATLKKIGLGSVRIGQFASLWSDYSWRTSAIEIRRFTATQLHDFDVGRNYIVTNGQVRQMPVDRHSFSASSFRLLEELERQRNRDLISFIKKKYAATHSPHEISDLIMKAASAVGAHQPQRTHVKGPLNFLEVQERASGAALDVRLLLDPLSKEARRVAPLLLDARRALGSDLNVELISNPVSGLSELPLASFYRYAGGDGLRFSDGILSAAAGIVSFEQLPVQPLYTLGMEAPEAWLLQQSVAKHDMDNIALTSVEEDVFALYTLEHLLVQGSCADVSSGRSAPRTMELALVNGAGDLEADTLVMQNYGYFQLKANPGMYKLRLASERSASVYEMAEQPVALSTFLGSMSHVTVTKKAGMEAADLLEVGMGGGEEETINVFSVASGHLYERFLKIMMLSVTKTATKPVRFWFLKNYLSPKFMDAVPVLAAEYGFEYEFVTYQWPDWLFGQTEKQRKIWGYKILFLDVLFPLDVHRVIFVDADLVVRGDLAELTDLDLGGAPYAYTPFCGSREEMDGYRFWTQGFWATHLGENPYHISALYVIDLDKFRQQAAGDLVRATYSNLAPDPNSLANLDQDLPNYMQSMLPIYSLPQEWLWCETWCSDESKAAAKAIDLCNNPLTKTPKLENAVRIVAEWTDLDEAVKEVERQHAHLLAVAEPDALLARAANEAVDGDWSALKASLLEFEPYVAQDETLGEGLAGQAGML